MAETEAERERRRRRLLEPYPAVSRDMEVARATVRPRRECPHCHPEILHREEATAAGDS